MRINHNIAALNTHRQLGTNTVGANKSLEKLSSGLRINRAGDDAAGLAISEKMRGQIRGLDQASRNAQDGISLIQTAEGALNETHSILQRMRELAVQSSSDTNTDQDRKNLQNEMDQLTKEIDRIRDTTQFNTKSLLDGKLASKHAASGGNVSANTAISGGASPIAATTAFSALTDVNGKSLGISGGSTIQVSWVSSGTFHTATLNGSDTFSTLGTTLSGATVGVDSNSNISLTSNTGLANAIHGLTLTVKDSSGNINSAATKALSSFTETSGAFDKQVKDGSLLFHIGSNTDENVSLAVNDMGSTALGVKDLKIDKQDRANVAIKAIDEATQKVSAERSKLGAMQNRLEHTINNLGTASENLTASESRIRDVDMAKEMMDFTKNNILTQAAQAMLAQANQQPQGVLQLLG